MMHNRFLGLSDDALTFRFTSALFVGSVDRAWRDQARAVVDALAETGIEGSPQAARATDASLPTALPDLVCAVGTDGCIHEMTREAAALFGNLLPASRPGSLLDLVHRDDRARMRTALADVRPETPIARIETRFASADAPERVLEWTLAWSDARSGLPPTNADPHASACIVAGARDVTDVRRAAQDTPARRERADASERRFHALVESSALIVWTADATGFVTEQSQAWERFTGQTPEQSSGWGWTHAIHPDDLPRIAPLWRTALAHQTSIDLEYRLRRLDGVYRWFSIHCVPVFDAAGAFVEWVGSSTDIEDRKQAEAARRTSDLHYATLLDHLPTAAYTCDAEGHIAYFNEHAATLWGRAPRLHDDADRFCGSLRLYTAEGAPLPHADSVMARCLRDGHEYAGEEKIVERPDGTRRTVLASATPLRDETGAVTGAVNVLMDITERTAHGRALRQSEERYHLVGQATHDAIWDYDIAADRVRWTPAIADHFGWTEALAGTTYQWWLDRVHPDDRAAVTTSVEREAAGEGSHWSNQYRFLRADGTYADVLDRGYLLTDGTGTPLRMAGAMFDATEMRRTDRALRQSEEHLRIALESASMGAWSRDVIGDLMEFSDPACEIFGVPVGSLNGPSDLYMALVHPDDLRHIYAGRARARESNGVFDAEYRIARPDGAIRWLHSRGHMYQNDAGEPVRMAGTIADVTERKERELQRRLLEAAVKDATESVLITDTALDAPGPRIVYVNAAFERMTGYAAADVIGQTPRILQGPLTDAALMTRLREDLEHGRPFQGQTVNYRKDGTPFEIEWSISPVANEHGETTHFVAVQRDITARKQAERDLRVAKERAEEMSRLKDSFLSNMSHEIRTPLTGILGFAEILAEHVDADGREFLDVIHANGQRLMDTLEAILHLAQLESDSVELTPSRFDAAAEVRRLVRTFEARAHAKGLELTVSAPPGEVPVTTDRSALLRLLSNLVSNALKFTREGRIDVRVTATETGVEVAVSDTGIGIGPDFLPHLFDDFAQESGGLSRMFEGNGIGLAINRHLARLLSAEITVESEQGQGSSFTVHLPESLPTSEGPPAWSAPMPEPSNTAVPVASLPLPLKRVPRILVIEDNKETQMLLRLFLENQYEVDIAPSYDAAVSQAQAHRYDALIVDITLEGSKTGVDVLGKLRSMEIYRHAPAIACTAYALPTDRERFLGHGFDDYISKPFRRKTVEDSLLRALSGDGSSAPPQEPAP